MPPSRNGLLQVFLSLLFILTGLLPHPCPASNSTDTIGVMEFTMDGSPNGEDWTSGLADFTMAMLNEYGIATSERRELNYVFSEFQLQDNGLARPEKIFRKKLPWVKYLVNGTVKPTGHDSFKLSISITDMASASEVGRFDQEGRYPDDVTKAVSELVKKLAGKIQTPGKVINQRADRAGFTNVPEIALLYYKGLDYYSKGKPEYAEYYFREAYRRDRTFVIAGSWLVRSFEALNLPDLSVYISNTLPSKDLPGELALIALKNKMATERKILSGIITPLEQDSYNEQLEKELRSAIINHPNLQLFSPDTVESLAQELDLELTGYFSEHSLRSQEWLSADILFSATKMNKGGKENFIRVQLIDSVSGKVIGSEEKLFNEPKSKEIIEGILQNLLTKNLRKEETKTQIKYVMAPQEKKPKKGAIASEIFWKAYLLRDFSENQKDKEKILAYFSNIFELDIPNPGYSWQFIDIILDRLEASLSPQDNDLAYYKFFIQSIRQKKYVNSMWNFIDPKTGMVKTQNDGLISEQLFNELLSEHSDSLPGLLARYNVAMDKLYAGDKRSAYLLLETTADAIADSQELNTLRRSSDLFNMQQGGLNDLKTELLSCIYYFTALTAYDIGDKLSAKKYAENAFESIKEFHLLHGKDLSSDFPRIIPAIYRLNKIDGNWFLVKDLLPPNLTVRDGIKNEIQNLVAELSGEKEKPLTIEQLKDRLSQQNTSQASKYKIAKEILNRIADKVRNGEDISSSDTTSLNLTRHLLNLIPSGGKDEAVTLVSRHAFAYEQQYNKLLTVCQNKKKACVEYDDLASKGNSHPLSPLWYHRLVTELYMICGQYSRVDMLADFALTSKYNKLRYNGIITKAWVLSDTQGPEVAANFMGRELKRYEKDFPNDNRENFCNLIYLTAQGYRDANMNHLALHTLRHGVEKTLPLLKQEFLFQDKKMITTLLYEQAVLEAQFNNLHTAVDLLKKIIKMSGPDSSVSINHLSKKEKQKNIGCSIKQFICNKGLAYDLALQKIEEIRAAGLDVVLEQ